MSGPRNARDVKLGCFVSQEINERLERLADAAGQHKGTTISVVIAAGLAQMEQVLLPQVVSMSDTTERA